ncbi:hypothetical protein BDK51DRAFT_39818 [Blyttiomyces helicus]|uniref:Transcription factor domain-containing protein n=1 Tax=Blyttiomyces helicus TaxID=388810 RepID=A0A4P9WJD0_9FUNG|nr:hypothetical protein BDK51DRAFT_39818 [Blyttiomyces helicus]|eukprot:RKO93029.1 hypothetical protein BDK51DRAFT_39818 [Blyttiomyces helicus]
MSLLRAQKSEPEHRELFLPCPPELVTIPAPSVPPLENSAQNTLLPPLVSVAVEAAAHPQTPSTVSSSIASASEAEDPTPKKRSRARACGESTPALRCSRWRDERVFVWGRAVVRAGSGCDIQYTIHSRPSKRTVQNAQTQMRQNPAHLFFLRLPQERVHTPSRKKERDEDYSLLESRICELEASLRSTMLIPPVGGASVVKAESPPVEAPPARPAPLTADRVVGMARDAIRERNSNLGEPPMEEEEKDLPFDLESVLKPTMDWYFSCSWTHYPFNFLHRAHFFANRHLQPRLLHFALIAYYGRWTKNPTIEAASEVAYGRARKLVASTLEVPTLGGVHGLVLLANAAASRHDLMASWVIFGVAAHFALHLKLDIDPVTRGVASWVECEIQRRTVRKDWRRFKGMGSTGRGDIVLLKYFVSTVRNKPSVIPYPAPSNVAFPCPEMPNKAVWFHANADGTLPPHLATRFFMNLSRFFLESLDMYHQALIYNRHSMASADPQAPWTFQVLHSDLKRWHASLPPEIETAANPDPSHSPTIDYTVATLITVLHHASRCFLHHSRMIAHIETVGLPQPHISTTPPPDPPLPRSPPAPDLAASADEAAFAATIAATAYARAASHLASLAGTPAVEATLVLLLSRDVALARGLPDAARVAQEAAVAVAGGMRRARHGFVVEVGCALERIVMGEVQGR